MTATAELRPPVSVDVDAVTLGLIRGALVSGVRELGSFVERTSKSPTINENHDYLIGFADRSGSFVAVVRSTSIVGGNLVRPIAPYYPIEDMCPGDIYCYNDPYISRGAISHTPDLVFVAPAFSDEGLLGFCAAYGHCRDIGGIRPGSLSATAKEIFHEGVLIPPVRIAREGRWNDEVLRMFVRNSRFPAILDSDIRALSAASRVGAARLAELAERFGHHAVVAGTSLLLQQSKETISRQLRKLIPDGTVRFGQAIDSDGQTRRPYWVRFALTKQDEQIEIDASGTDGQAQGPVNYFMDESVPMLALAMAVPPEDQSLLFNGSIGSIVDKVTLPPGSLLRPNFPAPLGRRSFTMGAVRHAMQGIAARVSNGRTSAARATHSGYVLRAFDERSNSNVLSSEALGVGLGAHPEEDGPDAIYGEAQRNIPCEYIERAAPVRMESYAINCDSGGPGLYRGGCGIVREFTFLGRDGEISPNLGNTVYAAWGVAGGQSGRPGSVVINPGTGRERALDPISEANKLAPGDVVRIATSGGGGWGHPFDRPEAIVRADVLNGFVSYESAFEDYGVVFDRQTGEIDEAATASRRRSSRPSAKLFHQGKYVDEIW
jgi:N-methylhydantoinase B